MPRARNNEHGVIFEFISIGAYVKVSAIDTRTGLGGGVESGLIGQTQVAPKPHNLNRTHACGTRITARLFLTA